MSSQEFNELTKLIEDIETVTGCVDANISFKMFAKHLIDYLNPDDDSPVSGNLIVGRNIFRR